MATRLCEVSGGARFRSVDVLVLVLKKCTIQGQEEPFRSWEIQLNTHLQFRVNP